jgi:hypothetical protein
VAHESKSLAHRNKPRCDPEGVGKFVQPLIHGVVLAREPDVTNPATLPKRQIETIILPPLAATMDDCCRIAEMLPAPSGETPLTVAILSIASPKWKRPIVPNEPSWLPHARH